LRQALEPCFTLAGPAVPGKAARNAVCGGDVLDDFSLNWEAEGLEIEFGAFRELRSLAIVEADVGGVPIVTRSSRCFGKQRPDIGSAQARNDGFVGYEIVRESRNIAIGPNDLVHFRNSH